ncbi:hypothetical protein C8J56DRAFT_499060 [Mycena floridula]|nr:hypothetical protein C8J56DRAFT_499060 [Mycena floridula]
MARLQSLIFRSRCTITTLFWANIPIKSTDWITLLRVLHSLQSLSIVDVGRVHVDYIGGNLITDAFFDLVNGPPDSLFLPSLHHLSLKVTKDIPAFSTRGLIRALQSRRTTEKEGKIVRLKSFELHLTRKLLDIQLLESLKELAGSGLKMVIQDKSGLVLC